MSTNAENVQRERIEAAKIIEASSNSLRMQLYVVTSIAQNMELVKQNIPDHLTYLKELENQNVLFGAGPMWTDDGQFFEGDGLMILRANSPEHAREIAAADPMHASDARTFTVRPWLLNDGSITIRITLSEPQRAVL